MQRVKGFARGRRAAALAGGGIALAFFGLQPIGVRAQTYTYSNTNGNFSGSFSPKLTTGSTSAILAFGGLGYTATDDLTTAVSLNTLSFTNGGAVALARGSGNGDSNTLNFDGPSSTIFLGNSTGTVGIGLDLNLGLHGINIDGSNSVNLPVLLSGVISGSGFVDLLGTTTTLSLSNTNNTYSGGTVFAGGTINIAGDGSLGATTTNAGQPNLDFAGGTLQFGANNITLNANRNVVLENYSTNAIDTQAFASKVAGVISGTGGFTVKGATGGGALALTGANTYSGGTTVTAGTLELAATAADGSGALLVNGPHSIVQLDVTGALGTGDVTLENGGTIVNNAGGGASGGHALTGQFIAHGSGTGASFTGLGQLTVGDGTSFLDYGAGNTGATFSFSSAGPFSGTLNILNWDDAPGADGGLDELIFGGATPSTLTAAQLADIEFIDPDGMTGTYAAAQDSSGSLFASTTQIGGAATAPEPGSVALLGVAGLPALRLLRRRKTTANG